MPLLVLITLATIEACTMIYISQKVETIAMEGARVGSIPGASATNVNYRCETLLKSHGVEGYTITQDPPNPNSLSTGDWFTVRIDADCNQNSLMGGWFYAGRQITQSVTLRAE